MRTCTYCKHEKPLEAFCLNKRKRDGIHTTCRDCVRESALRRKYGIDNRTYEAMLAAQGGGCAICGRSDDVLCVDHNHACCPGRETCGKCVRGLLCRACNGFLRYLDEPHTFDRVVEYMKGHTHDGTRT